MGKRSGEKELDFDIDDLWINPYSSNAVRNIYEVKFMYCKSGKSDF